MHRLGLTLQSTHAVLNPRVLPFLSSAISANLVVKKLMNCELVTDITAAGGRLFVIVLAYLLLPSCIVVIEFGQAKVIRQI
jgi:hypothetical protein